MRLEVWVLVLVLGGAVTTMYVTAWRHGQGFGEQALASAELEPQVEPAPGELAGGNASPPAAEQAEAEPAAESETWYQYADEQGSMRFANSLGAVPARYREDATKMEMSRLRKTSTTGTRPRATRRQRARVPVQNFEQVWGGDAARGDVILYGASWCGACRKAIAHLNERGVDFEQKDVENDAEAEAEYLQKSKGRRGIPLIDVGGKVLQGFSPRSLDAALANRG